MQKRCIMYRPSNADKKLSKINRKKNDLFLLKSFYFQLNNIHITTLK